MCHRLKHPLWERGTPTLALLWLNPRHHRLPSINPSVQWEPQMTAEDGLKQVQEASLAAEKVVKHFPKTYKARSPRNTQERCQRRLGGLSGVESEAGGGAPKASAQQVCEDQTLEISGVQDQNKLVVRRYPGDLEAPNLRNEEEVPIQLKEIGRSVCLIFVGNASQGTGFVLFDNVILTSAHLFRRCTEGKRLLDHISVSVVFQLSNRLQFTVDKTLVDIDEELDYAALALISVGQAENQPEKVEVPPGLLRRLGQLQGSGEICIIGHPAGREKKFCYTSNTDEEDRERVVEAQLAKFDEHKKKIIKCDIENEGINDILVGGRTAKLVITYCSSMYEGSSGSPVIAFIDGQYQVIGLHTGGYSGTLSPGLPKICVMQFARPMLTIFEKFVRNQTEMGNWWKESGWKCRMISAFTC